MGRCELPDNRKPKTINHKPFPVSAPDWDGLITRYLAERAGRAKRAALVEEVARLSAMFNGPREMSAAGAPYLDRRPARAAYAAYFAPANAGKVVRILRELAACDPGFFGRSSLRALDLGCGTGAGGLGLAAFLAERGLAPRVAYEGVDASEPALEDARWFLAEVAPAWEVTTRGGDVAAAAGAGRADLVFLIDVLNEVVRGTRDPVAAGARLLRSALDGASPGGYLVVVEPALRGLTRRLHAVRDALCAEGGIRVAAPCLHERPCPALARASAWCHEERPWDRPGILGEIDRRLGHDKRWLKYAYMALTREGKTLAQAVARRPGGAPPAAAWRAVTNRHDLKGRTRIMGCGAAGWCDVECLARDRSDATRPFFELRRGDVFGAQGVAESGGALRLSSDQRVERWDAGADG